MQKKKGNGVNYLYGYILNNSLYSISVWDIPKANERQIRGLTTVKAQKNAQGQTILTTTDIKLTDSNMKAAADGF